MFTDLYQEEICCDVKKMSARRKDNALLITSNNIPLSNRSFRFPAELTIWT